jgi:predicted ribosomally synthesized peptide with nif11-like leader
MLAGLGDGLHKALSSKVLAMSEEQLAALFARLDEDAGLAEKLKGATGLYAIVAIAREAGFDISTKDWLNYQATSAICLGDDELEGMNGGTIPFDIEDRDYPSR